MNATQRVELWDRLRQSGIVAGDLPDDAGDMSPWYVRAMVGVAAWIAALFLVLAVGIGLEELLKSSAATAVAGLVICAAAIALMRANATGVFATQLALAGSLTGQALVAYALFNHAQRLDLTPWLLLCAFEVTLIVVAPNYVHRALATLAALVAARAALVVLGLWAVFPALAAAGFVAVHSNEARLVPRASLWQPVATGLALAALASAGQGVLGADGLFWEDRRSVDVPAWVGSAAIAGVLLATTGRLLRDARLSPGSRLALWAWLAALALIPAAWPMPGLVVALIVLLVAFATGHHALVGLSALALLAVLSHYYYSLQTTLLVKSGALLATGLVLLGAGYVLHRVVPRAKENGHA